MLELSSPESSCFSASYFFSWIRFALQHLECCLSVKLRDTVFLVCVEVVMEVELDGISIFVSALLVAMTTESQFNSNRLLNLNVIDILSSFLFSI